MSEEKAIEYDLVDLTEDEKEEAETESLSQELLVERLKLQKKQLEREIDLGVHKKRASRQADEQYKKFLQETESQLETARLNLKVYEDRVKIGKKQVPKEPKEEVSVEEQPQEEVQVVSEQ